jgi:hypothetical protein
MSATVATKLRHGLNFLVIYLPDAEPEGLTDPELLFDAAGVAEACDCVPLDACCCAATRRV